MEEEDSATIPRFFSVDKDIKPQLLQMERDSSAIHSIKIKNSHKILPTH